MITSKGLIVFAVVGGGVILAGSVVLFFAVRNAPEAIETTDGFHAIVPAPRTESITHAVRVGENFDTGKV